MPSGQHAGAAREHQQRDVPQVEAVGDLAHPGERAPAHPAHARPGAEHERRDHGGEGHRRAGVREHLHREAACGHRSHATGHWPPGPPRRRRRGRRSRTAPRGGTLLARRASRPAARPASRRRSRAGTRSPCGRQPDPSRRDSRRSSTPGRPPRARRAAAACRRALRPSRSASQPDQGEQQVEDHLDGQRPRGGIQLQQRVGRVVLARTGRTCGSSPASTEAAPRHVARQRQQEQRPGQRHVVRGRDAGRAAHQVAADGDRPAAAAAPRARTRGTAGSPTARRT